MEVKKTNKASLKDNNMLYFLGGLNVVLLVIWGLFSYKQTQKEIVIEEPVEIVETTEAILIDIPEPETPPPPPPPSNEPPPPPPPEVPQVIEETPEEVEVPDIAPQEKKLPQVQTSNATGPIKKVDLSGLKGKANETKEERVNEPVTINRVAEMAVYPGCEKKKGKNQLKKCFGEKLGRDVIRFLDAEYPDTDKPAVKVQLEFIVNTDGYIEKIVPKRGDEIFKGESKRAMRKVAEYLKRKGKKIKPAKMADGSDAPLIFHQVVALQNPDA